MRTLIYITALIMLVSCNTNKKEETKTPSEFGMYAQRHERYLMDYVCIDSINCLHVTRRCPILRDRYQIEYIDTNRLIDYDYTYCSQCVNYARSKHLDTLLHRGGLMRDFELEEEFDTVVYAYSGVYHRAHCRDLIMHKCDHMSIYKAERIGYSPCKWCIWETRINWAVP